MSDEAPTPTLPSSPPQSQPVPAGIGVAVSSGHSGSPDDPAPPDELKPLFDALQPRAAAFLNALRLAGTLIGAARLSGVSTQSHYRWSGRLKESPGDPAYVRAFEAVLEQVKDDFDALMHDRVVNGLREAQYRVKDGEKTLAFERIRHDSSLLKMYGQALNPEKYGREGSVGVAVQIVINEVDVSE